MGDHNEDLCGQNNEKMLLMAYFAELAVDSHNSKYVTTAENRERLIISLEYQRVT